MSLRRAAALALLAAASCARPAPPLEFRTQCAADEPGALPATLQGIAMHFGPPRRFAVQSAAAVDDAEGHPAILLILAPEARQAFEAYTSVSAEGPLGIFLGDELVAAPAARPVAGGRLTFCNEAGGWSARDRDRWLERIRAGLE